MLHSFGSPVSRSTALDARQSSSPCIRQLDGGAVSRGAGRVYLRTNGAFGFVVADCQRGGTIAAQFFPKGVEQ